MIRTVEVWPIPQRLFILELLEKVDHELVAIVLHDWIESPTQQALQSWLDDPLFGAGRFIEYYGVKLVDAITEVKIVSCSSCATLQCDIIVILHDEVITQLPDRQ